MTAPTLIRIKNFMNRDNKKHVSPASLVQEVVSEERAHKTGWSCRFINDVSSSISQMEEDECRVFMKGIISHLKSEELTSREQFKICQFLALLTARSGKRFSQAVYEEKNELIVFRNGLEMGVLIQEVKNYINGLIDRKSVV